MARFGGGLHLGLDVWGVVLSLARTAQRVCPAPPARRPRWPRQPATRRLGSAGVRATPLRDVRECGAPPVFRDARRSRRRNAGDLGRCALRGTSFTRIALGQLSRIFAPAESTGLEVKPLRAPLHQPLHGPLFEPSDGTLREALRFNHMVRHSVRYSNSRYLSRYARRSCRRRRLEMWASARRQRSGAATAWCSLAERSSRGRLGGRRRRRTTAVGIDVRYV